MTTIKQTMTNPRGMNAIHHLNEKNATTVSGSKSSAEQAIVKSRTEGPDLLLTPTLLAKTWSSTDIHGRRVLL
jgi:hypothetical protein